MKSNGLSAQAKKRAASLEVHQGENQNFDSERGDSFWAGVVY